VSRWPRTLSPLLTRKGRAWLHVVAVTLASAAIAATFVALRRHDPVLAAGIRHLVLPGAMLALLLLVAVRHERRWRRGSQELAGLIRQVRLGERSPSMLLRRRSDRAEELAALAGECARLAKDLHEQHRLVRRLELDCKHQVAHRTNALERQVNLLRSKARRDALTGLNNRGSFEELYPAMVRRAREAGRDLSVVMADLDDFKLLNDTLGHPAGDRMLREVGRVVQSAIREADAAFRYGGDEFVLVLDGADPLQARAMADRVARIVDDLGSRLAIPRRPGLSCGVASVSEHPRADASGLLQAADADVYRVKSRRKAARSAA
jgi:diguanylate cyclase (GGDEF)-like protein